MMPAAASAMTSIPSAQYASRMLAQAIMKLPRMTRRQTTGPMRVEYACGAR